VIDIRAGILAIVICLLIALAANQPPKPLPQNAPLCVQYWFNKWGDMTAREWVPCDQLNRAEIA
jgi:hypothetical protein